jgi:hypothetical protein
MAAWPALVAVIFTGGAARVFVSAGVGPFGWLTFRSVVTIVSAGIIGLFVGVLSAMPVTIPLYQHRARVNGAPFRIGDAVRVLCGPHRGHVGRVYAVWAERGQVRVEVSDAARETVADVFSNTEVLKVSDSPG